MNTNEHEDEVRNTTDELRNGTCATTVGILNSATSHFEPRTSNLPLRALCNSSSNSTESAFRLEQTDFIQLSPIGVFPHSKGFQQVDRPALERLVKNFNGFFARLGRRFAGVPLYVGHPDVPGLEAVHPDRKAYGWIMELELRDDGLFGRPKWSAAGRDLIANGHFKFLSPYWKAEAAGMFQGRPAFRPTELLSVGLTNEPNLPVLPLANNAESAGEDATCLGASVQLGGTELHRERRGAESAESIELEGRAPARPAANSSLDKVVNHRDTEDTENTEEVISPQSTQRTQKEEPIDLEGRAAARPASPLELSSPPHSALSSSSSADSASPRSLCNSSPLPSVDNSSHLCSSVKSPSAPPCPLCTSSSQAPISDFDPCTSHLEERLARCQEEIALLNERLVNTLLDQAIADARVFPAERAQWQAALADNFEEASTRLANAAPKLNLTSRIGQLPRRAGVPCASEEKQRRMLALVNETMRATGLGYHEAWVQTRAEKPELF